MRPLNRPMFRYGGPIKEGIMDGMKDGGRMLLAGEHPKEFKDASGREQHFAPLIAAGMGIARLAPLAMRGARAAQSLFGRRKFVKDLGTKLPLKPGGAPFTPVKNIFEPNKLGAYLMASPEFKFATGAGGKASKFVGGALKGLKRSPLGIALTAGTLTDVLPGGRPFGPDKFLPNILGQRFDEQGNKIPGTGFFNPDKVEKGETEGMKRVETIGAGEGSTGGGVTDDPDKAKQIQEDRIAKTKKRYYELMGLDKMKKDAAYDSLIDASRIVQEQGGDLKGAIKSGTLQSQIINAISKNLDKSADIKRQIDAAILKGEIQKDVASADSVDKDLKKARIKQLNRAEKQAGASGQIAAVIAKDGVISGSQTAAILRADGVAYDGVLQDKLFNNFKKDNPAADEIDFMIAKGKDLDDGRYVIGARLVEKKGPNVAFIV